MNPSYHWLFLLIVAVFITGAGIFLYRNYGTHVGQTEGMPKTGIGGGPNNPLSLGTKTIKMNPVDPQRYDQNGVVTFTENNGNVTVTINVDTPGDLSGSQQPAHIHFGGCPGVGDIAYPLNTVINGKSTTVLDVSLDELRDQEPLAVNVHKSPTELDIYTTCSDINF